MPETKRWEASCSIDGSSIPLYDAEMREMKRSIEELSRSYSEEDSIETRKRNLASQLHYYNLFEAYRIIAVQLGATNVPQLEKTRIGAELAYQELLEEEQKDLETTIEEYEARKISALQTSAYNELQKARTALELNKAQQALFVEENIRKQEEATNYLQRQNQILLDAMRAKVSAQVKSLSSISAQTDSAESFVGAIEAKKQRYESIQQTLQGEIAQRRSDAQAELDRQSAEIMNRPYPAAEMSGGQPIERAEQKRKTQVSDLEKTSKKQLDKEIADLTIAVEPQSKQIRESIKSDYEVLEKLSFSLDSIHDEITIAIDSYDGNRYAWPFVVKTKLFGRNIQVEGYVPYETLSGKRLPNFTRYDSAYDEYVDQVEILQAFLLGGQSLHARIDFTVQVKDEPSTYHVDMGTMTVRRLDTQDAVIQLDLAKRGEYDFEYIATPQIDIRTKSEIREQQQAEAAAAQAKREAEEKARKKALAKKPVGYYRNGLVIDYGIGISALFDDNTEVYYAVSAEYPLTVCPYLYLGPAVDVFMNFSNLGTSANVVSSAGLYFMIGGVIPFNLIGFQMKLYGDYRMGAGANFSASTPQYFSSFASIVNLGISVEFGNEIWFDFGLKAKVTGADAGLSVMYMGIGWDLGGLW